MPTSFQQTDQSSNINALAEDVRSKWGWFLLLGVILIMLGGVALGNLLVATLVTVYYIGALILVGGVVQIVHAFQVKEWGNFFIWLLSGVFYGLAGIFAFMNPVLATEFLTLLLAVSLIVAGIFRMWAGFSARPRAGWGWLVAAGLLALIVGLVIAARWPVNSLYLIGMILAIELIFEGWSFVAVALALRARRGKQLV
ncbi:HdeD family acid-resistance protein [Pseudochelatococcus sp. G4_1912]|uniref:HdeD family acid-resistance protein n=1 Tax=Pseudochelatococcus sp. G4_1912 TaxID=3114288 RepID=UPI0039C71F3F